MWDNDDRAQGTGHRDVILIPHDHLVEGSATYGLMLSVWPFGGATASFALVIQSEDTNVNLYSGLPLRDLVETGQYEYFEYTVPHHNVPTFITVEVTPITGDPDLFESKSQKVWLAP